MSTLLPLLRPAPTARPNFPSLCPTRQSKPRPGSVHNRSFAVLVPCVAYLVWTWSLHGCEYRYINSCRPSESRERSFFPVRLLIPVIPSQQLVRLDFQPIPSLELFTSSVNLFLLLSLTCITYPRPSNPDLSTTRQHSHPRPLPRAF